MTITVAEALTKHQNGTLVPNDIFYDWFCSNKALVGRTKTLATKLKMLAKSSLIHPETDTVFLKTIAQWMASFMILFPSVGMARLFIGSALLLVTPLRQASLKCLTVSTTASSKALGQT